MLYHIWILHQTTTIINELLFDYLLYHIWILHQTTTSPPCTRQSPCCIIFGFYIKPQPTSVIPSPTTVVSYLDSTSNHNRPPETTEPTTLYHIWILHQTTTGCILTRFSRSCIIFGFYIKPQRRALLLRARAVVSYLDSTSNHNLITSMNLLNALYHIWILHQTTTGWLR